MVDQPALSDTRVVRFGTDIVAAAGVDPLRCLVVEHDNVNDAMRMQSAAPYQMVVLHMPVAAGLSAMERRLLVHNLVGHLEPGGRLVAIGEPLSIESDAFAMGMDPVAALHGHPVWQRAPRRTIHDMLVDARRRIARVDASTLSATLASPGCDTVVLDTRAPDDRERDGVIAGSFHTPRTVLEWRVDPASGYSLEAITRFDQPVVVVCNGGYSSSMAAATLIDLGFCAAGDLIGGIQAWRDAGLPLHPPTEHFIEEIV